MMRTVILAFVPVLHRGYVEFFQRHPEAKTLYLIGDDLVGLSDYLHKEIRALGGRETLEAIRSWKLFRRVGFADMMTLAGLNTPNTRVVMPDEDISRLVATEHLQRAAVSFDTVFLRWDRTRALAQDEVQYDRSVPFAGFVGDMMNLAQQETAHAANWWRQVGAVIARDQDVLLVGHNTPVPSPHVPYAEGDPRNLFKRGVQIDLSTDFHAEAQLISEAARRGIALAGTSLYVTTFPCPPCAKIVAYSGIAQCYFASGYAMLDGERILHAKGVELIYVPMKNPPS